MFVVVVAVVADVAAEMVVVFEVFVVVVAVVADVGVVVAGHFHFSTGICSEARFFPSAINPNVVAMDGFQRDSIPFNVLRLEVFFEALTHHD